MKKIIIFCALVSSMYGSYALSESSVFNQHVGPYAEITAGPNFYFLHIISSEGSFNRSGFQGFGWNAAGGYNLTNHFGLEGGFMQNYVKLLTRDSISHHKEYKYHHLNAPYAAARFTVPIGERFSFIGKLGAMNAMVPSKSLVLPFVGVGGSYAVTHSLDLTVQYQGAVYGFWNAGLLGAGLVYHF